MLLESHNLRYFVRVLHVLHAIRRTLAKTNTYNRHNNLAVINVDRVLLANFLFFFSIHHASASHLIFIEPQSQVAF
jgi:hypothetical protein